MNSKKDDNYFRGCLIGGAIGDALGYKIEFDSVETIKKRFGEAGLVDLVCDDVTGKAIISDDTQMTLFTAEGILWADHRGRERGICSYESCVFYSYQRWLFTQTERLADGEYNWLLEEEKADYKSELLHVKELHQRRAPGNTCLTALKKCTNQNFGTIERLINDSKGCGGVMRVAPVGLYFSDRPEQAFRTAANCAAITHGHPNGYLSAGVLACIIAGILNGMDIKRAALNSIEILKTFKGNEETLRILNQAIELAEGDSDPYTAISKLGQGWVGEETLAIALYCSLKHSNDFAKALRLAVNHSGDSDSTGAVCGNILGAYLGIQSIPERWINQVELSDLVISIADKLVKLNKEG